MKSDLFLRHDEPIKSCLQALRSLILDADKNVTETIRYGMPCFCYKNKMFCYLWVDKKTSEPYLLMVEGKHLHHPKLEQGNRSRMKIFRVDAGRDIPVRTINQLLKSALDLYRKGIIKLK